MLQKSEVLSRRPGRLPSIVEDGGVEHRVKADFEVSDYSIGKIADGLVATGADSVASRVTVDKGTPAKRSYNCQIGTGAAARELRSLTPMNVVK